MRNDSPFVICRFKAVDSTNDVAKKCSSGHVIIADVQNHGRGRLGRAWHSPLGGLWMSVVVEDSSHSPEHFTRLAMESVKKALKDEFNVSADVKEPNDLLFLGRKICGILTENVYKGPYKKQVIGIGLNINNDIPKELAGSAIALKEIIRREADISDLSMKILNNFFMLLKSHD